MKRTIKPISRSIVIVVALIAAMPAFLYAWEGKVVGVSDGDTIMVLKAGEQVKVRLASIDCPEKGKPHNHATSVSRSAISMVARHEECIALRIE